MLIFADTEWSPTDWLSIYGAALATILALREWWLKRSVIKVQLMYAIDDRLGHGICVEVQNRSWHEMHVQAVWLTCPYRKRWWGGFNWMSTTLSELGETGFPTRMAPRGVQRVFVADAQIERLFAEAADRRVRGWVQDAFGNDKGSRVMKIPKGV